MAISGLELTEGIAAQSATATQQGNKAAFELADSLDSINSAVQDVDAKFHAENIINSERMAAVEKDSHELTQRMLENKADPWHDLKVLFTDKKSNRDLIADHNQVEHRRNELTRSNRQRVQQYQYDLGLQSDALGLLQAKQEQSATSVQNTSAQAQAVITQLGSGMAVRQADLKGKTKEQLDTLMADINAGKNTGHKALEVKEMQDLWLKREATINRANLTKDKAALNKALFDVADFDQLSRGAATGTGIAFKYQGDTITFNKAETLTAFNQQRASNAEVSAANAARVDPITTSLQLDDQINSVASRYAATAGVNIYKPGPRDVNGDPTLIIDQTKMPGADSIENAEVNALTLRLMTIDEEIVGLKDGGALDGNDNGRVSILLQKNDERTLVARKLHGAQVSQVDAVVTQEQARFKTDESKATIADYYHKGFNAPGSEATNLAAYEAIVNNAAINAGYSNLPPGWEEAAAVMQKQLLERSKQASGGDTVLNLEGLNDDEKREAQLDQILASITQSGSKKKLNNVILESLHAREQDAEGNAIGEPLVLQAAMDAWNKLSFQSGIQRLGAKFKAIPEINEVFASLTVSGTTAGLLDPRYSIDANGSRKLFSDLHRASIQMHGIGVLPPDQDLAELLQAEMLSDEFFKNSPVKAIINSPNAPYLQSLMNAMAFGNNAAHAWESTFRRNVGNIDLRSIMRFDEEGEQFTTDSNLVYDELLANSGYTPNNVPDRVKFDLLAQASEQTKARNKNRARVAGPIDDNRSLAPDFFAP